MIENSQTIEEPEDVMNLLEIKKEEDIEKIWMVYTVDFALICLHTCRESGKYLRYLRVKNWPTFQDCVIFLTY